MEIIIKKNKKVSNMLYNDYKCLILLLLLQFGFDLLSLLLLLLFQISNFK
jgi:hypothetical protein